MSETNSQPSSQAQNSNAKPAASTPVGGLATFAEALAAAQVVGDSEQLGGSDAEGADEAAEQPKQKRKPKNLAEASQLLGIDDAEFYKLAVPSAVEGAEPYTLGALKDLAKEHDDFALAKLAHEQKGREQQAQYLRATQELEDIMAAIPPDALKPELREQLKTRRENAMSRERQLVLDRIPEWKDATVRTSELEAMEEHLRDSGFPSGYLAGVYDHRTLRYIRANMLREKAIAAALARVKETRPTSIPKSNAKGSPAPAKKPSGARTREEVNHARFGAHILNASKR